MITMTMNIAQTNPQASIVLNPYENQGPIS